MTPMALDLFIGFVILLSTIVAYLRGIIKETFTVLALLLGSFVAFKAGHLLTPVFNDLLSVPENGISKRADYVLFGVLSPAMASKAMSFGGLFVLVYAIITLIGLFLTRWMLEVGVNFVDSLLGAIFGFIRGFLLVFLFYVPFTYLVDAEKMPPWAKESYSINVMKGSFEWVSKTFELEEKIKDTSEGLTIKFDKIDPNDIGKDKKEVKGKVEKVTDAIQDAVVEGSKGMKDTIKGTFKDEKIIDNEMPTEPLDSGSVKDAGVKEERIKLLDKEEEAIDPFSEAYFADEKEIKEIKEIRDIDEP